MLRCTVIKNVEIYLFLFALILTVSLIYTLISISRKRKLFDYPEGRKSHSVPTPFLGGVGIYLAFWISFLLISYFCSESLFDGQPFLPAMLISSTLIFLLGLADDFLDLKFYVKVLVQALAAVILIVYGFSVVRLYIPFWGSFELGWMSYPATIAWVVLITNSINLIDGMDGLAGVVSLSVCLGLLIISAFLNIALISAIAIIMAGCLIGFLIFNRPPAKIFMGDSGSLFVGYMFAVAAIACPIKSYTAVSMFVPLVAVSLPLLEMVTTIIRRTVSGKKIYQPDNRHIFHYLQEFRFSQKTTLIILGSVSLLFNAFIPALFWFDRREVFSIFVVFLMLLIVIFFILKLVKGAGRL